MTQQYAADEESSCDEARARWHRIKMRAGLSRGLCGVVWIFVNKARDGLQLTRASNCDEASARCHRLKMRAGLSKGFCGVLWIFVNEARDGVQLTRA